MRRFALIALAVVAAAAWTAAPASAVERTAKRSAGSSALAGAADPGRPQVRHRGTSYPATQRLLHPGRTRWIAYEMRNAGYPARHLDRAAYAVYAVPTPVFVPVSCRRWYWR